MKTYTPTDPLLLDAIGLLKRHIAPPAKNGIGDDSLFAETSALIRAYEDRMCGLPVLELPEGAIQRIMEILENPPPPSEGLREAYRRYRELQTPVEGAKPSE